MTRKKKTYHYQQYYSERTGEVKERPLGSRLVDNWEEISVSRDSPATRKRKRELYEAGLLGLGDKTGGEYSDTVN